MPDDPKLPILYRRNLSKESQMALDDFGTLTAETIWAWNRNNSILMALFSSLLSPDLSKDHIAHAIWHTFQSDSSQRDLLLQTAKVCLRPKSIKYKQIDWLIKAVNKIAPYRNAIIHVPMIFQETKPGRPNNIALDIGGARLAALDKLTLAGSKKAFWRAISGDLMVLTQFALALSGAVKQVGISPLLHRPRLRTPQLFQQIDAQLNRQQSKAKPKRPRPASRG